EAKHRVHLLAVYARRELAALGEGPAPGVIGVIAFIRFESADSRVHKGFAVISAKNLSRPRVGKVWGQTTPYAVIAGMRFKGGKHGRRGVCVGVLPEIDLVMQPFGGLHKPWWIWKTIFVPHKRAGV